MFSHFWFLSSWRRGVNMLNATSHHGTNAIKKSTWENTSSAARRSRYGNLLNYVFCFVVRAFCSVEHSILHFQSNIVTVIVAAIPMIWRLEREREPLIRSVLSCLRKGTLIIFSLIFPRIQLHSAHIGRLSGARIQISNFGGKKIYFDLLPSPSHHTAVAAAPHTMLQWQSTDISCSPIFIRLLWVHSVHMCVCVDRVIMVIYSSKCSLHATIWIGYSSERWTCPHFLYFMTTKCVSGSSSSNEMVPNDVFRSSVSYQPNRMTWGAMCGRVDHRRR